MGIENFVKQGGISPDEASKMISVAESALSSTKRAQLDNNLSKIEANLKSIGGADWQGLKDFCEKAEMSDEERSAVDRTVSILQNVKAVSDKEAVIKRSAKNFRDIAIAVNFFSNSGISGGRIAKGSDLAFSAEQLLDAVSHFGDENDLDGIERPGVMGKEELAEAKKHLEGLNIS